MEKDQRWVRLQVKGGTDLNFVLPANPNWKISNLEEHMIKIYNEVSAHEISNRRAAKIRSLKKNGFYVAPSLKVRDVFNDWDEVSCHIVLSDNSEEEPQERNVQESKRNQTRNNEQPAENNNKKQPQRKASQPKQKIVQIKDQKKNDNKKGNKKKQQVKPSPTISQSKLINLLQTIRNEKKDQDKSEKKSQRKDAEEKESNKREEKTQTKIKTKSGAIIIRGDSDSD